MIADARALFVQVEVEHFLRGADEMPTGWREHAEHADLELPW